MKYKVDKTIRPAYLQIYNQIKEDIISGVLEHNAKLPSKRLLAAETNTSTVTVEHAYGLLTDEGYVEARERSGYFVIFKSSDGFSVAEREIAKPSPQPLHSHSYPDFPFSVLSKTMRNVLAVYGERILEQSPGEGCVELREALAWYLARNRGMHITVDQIVIGSGAEYLYGLIIELLGRERIYGIEDPSYEKIQQVYRAAEVPLQSLKLSHDGIDSTALANTNANVLHTTPYRSFPSGVTASASKRFEYIRWMKQGNRYIIEDDFESEFSVSTKPEDTLFSLSGSEDVIYMNSFSKTISPALRVGYMVLPKSLVAPFRQRLGFYACTVPTFEQLVIASLLNNGDFERNINRVRRKLRKALSEHSSPLVKSL
ncbi:MAG: PLP-dependent aminotransferase family protein [Oscillospiraceae bacterium]|nr:PLP-dependent aminotransferase family protein [Oscillospiraceae bacterium]